MFSDEVDFFQSFYVYSMLVYDEDDHGDMH